MLAAPLIALARSSCLPACLSRLASVRKNTHTVSHSFTTHSLYTRHCSVPSHCVRHSSSLPPPRFICYLAVCLAALRSASAAHLQEWISDRSQQRGRPTITAYYSACNRAEHRLCYDSHFRSPAAVRDAINALTLNRMHDLFQLETLLPGAGAPSNANLHLRLAADDRCHHRGQCILNRTTIATSSVRRDT